MTFPPVCKGKIEQGGATNRAVIDSSQIYSVFVGHYTKWSQDVFVSGISFN
jgi:hypothetical protein